MQTKRTTTYDQAFAQEQAHAPTQAQSTNPAPVLDVFVASIPHDGSVDVATIFPPARQQAIANCGSEKTALGRYYAWKLLAYGLQQTFALELQSLHFSQQSTGKLTCEECEFSLSHSHGVVCVALSNAPVGVDVERIAPIDERAVQRLLCEEERQQLPSIAQAARAEHLIGIWTKKESIFKCKGGTRTALEINTLRHETLTTAFNLNGNGFCLSVASAHLSAFRLFTGIDLRGL